jgi:hypothetical protein
MDGSRLDYVLMGRVLASRGVDIERLYNRPVDVHFSNDGVRAYGNAVYDVLRRYLIADHAMGRPQPSNLALGRPASQSSTDADLQARLAADGNVDGDASHHSVASTRREHQPWWAVDLGRERLIDAVRIHNRTDCCAERLRDFVVLVSVTPFAPDYDPGAPRPGVARYHIADDIAATISIPIGVTGRHVRVQLLGDNYLSLAEVEVMGRTWSILEQTLGG